MTTFNSDNFLVQTTHKSLHEFISNPSNLYHVLPKDRIENWKETEDGCSFKIKGLAEINLKLESQSEDDVIYASISDKPFPFKLKVKIINVDGDKSEISASFDAEVNSFMSMMLKTPLTNFLNSLGSAIRDRFASS